MSVASPAPDSPVAAPRFAAPLVAATGVSITAGGRCLIENVDLTLHAGEIVTLIGPNGAGKTTLVRALLGLCRPERGQVWRRPGLRVGYVPQRLSVDPVLPLSVRRFLCLPRRRPEAALRQALDEVGAADLLERPVQALSGGEFQRVALARALLREPDLLVLDEPLQAVDFAGQIALYHLIGAMRDRRGCGILLVSHDIHLVMSGTDRVVCLNRHICCAGRPEAVRRHPAFLALFGPQAGDTLSVYAHRHDHAHDSTGEVVPLSAAEEPQAPPAVPQTDAHSRGRARR